MRLLNFLIQGLGFDSFAEFKISAFGYVLYSNILQISAVAGVVTSIAQVIFGFNWQFLVAYVILVIFEWVTGVKASLKKGQKHESRKLGRMLFKILVYTLIVFLLNTFKANTNFPIVFGYEIDPFNWLYWMALFVIIWQLLISVLENLDVLGFPFASKLIKIINKKVYQNKDII